MALPQQDPYQQFLASIGAARLDSAGRPIGSTGGSVAMSPGQEQQLAQFRAPAQASGGPVAPAAPTQGQGAPAQANPLDFLNKTFGTNIGAPKQGIAMQQATDSLAPTVQMGQAFQDLGEQNQAAVIAQRIKDAGLNLTPGLPGFNQQKQAAEGIYRQVMSQNQAQQGNAFMRPGNAYMGEGPAPTGAQVLAAGGEPVTGYGGTQISGRAGPNGNNQFFLKQGPQPPAGISSRPAPVQQPAQVQQGPDPLVDAQRQYRDAVTPRVKDNAPSGYRSNPDGTLSYIPGGPADPSRSAPAKPNLGTDQEMGPDGRARFIPGSKGEVDANEQASKAQLRQRNAVENARSVVGFIDKALPEVGYLTAGVGAAALAKLPHTSARDLAAKLDTIRANIGFDRLQQMRMESPTGGALGQIAVKELEFLQAVKGNLDNWQSPAELIGNLIQIRDSYERFLMANSGFDPDNAEQRGAFYESTGQNKGGATPAAESDEASSVDDLISKYTK
jgi:hypothetical protein